jgi:acetyl-CoA carboxylase biotin carboxylase subunit
VYSEADVDSLHVQLADEAICIGPAPSASSYLKIDRIISAAEVGDVDAIHPGYGFLSENAHFAEVCDSCNIKFIGPSAAAIRAMGDKNVARETARKAGVPVTPGSDGIVGSEADAVRIAKKIGYPVMIKATAGGGGRGMRICRSAAELPGLFQAASSEAAGAFGNGDLYMEKFIERPRHIEFQVLADEHGSVISLGERECSIQRRHQKLIEEAPSLMITPKLREELGKTIKKALENIGYWNAGTIEFLMDEDGKIYFIEMNTRIQVEHCVTEMVTGIDLVKAQLRIAAGEKLSSIITRPVEIRGHAIECRINAEHPEKFTPSAGKITAFNLPGGNGVRVDTAQYAEGVVPPYYDSLIAKLICHGSDREDAMNKMQRALSQFVVQGIHTTIPLHQKIFADAEFRSGQFDTKFMERFFERQKDS